MTPRARRAQAFAETYFSGCAAHRREAEGAFEALEDLTGRALLAVTADIPVGAVVAPSVSAAHAEDTADDVELQMAVEEEFGDSSLAQEALDVARADHVLRTLLGPATEHNTWDPETVWLRSLRGIVNERVRHRGGCTCAEAERPGRKALPRVH